MSVRQLDSARREPDSGTVSALRERMRQMSGGVPRLPLVTPPELSGLLDLRTGGAYQVDSAALVLSLLAGPSRAGSWAAVVGAPDLGVEAAEEAGVELGRLVLVPDPGEHWLEVVAALVDVVTMVVLRPPPGVSERAASRVAARLRKRSAVLLAWGDWPGCEARLSLESSVWEGIEQGHGRLRSRRSVVAVSRGSAPPRRTELRLSDVPGEPEIRVDRRARMGVRVG